MYASGPVVIWHAMDIAAVSHIRFIGFRIHDVFSASPSDHSPCSHGNMNAIPAMAAYESWNPTSRTASGDMHRWMISAVISTDPVFLKRPVNLAYSPRNMNRKARRLDAPAPVAKV